MFPDMGDKLPEMTDQQPLPVESTVLRQLPHINNSLSGEEGPVANRSRSG